MYDFWLFWDQTMENVAMLTEDGEFAIFFRPHPRRFDSSRVPNPSKAKKKLMPGVDRGGGGEEGLGV